MKILFIFTMIFLFISLHYLFYWDNNYKDIASTLRITNPKCIFIANKVLPWLTKAIVLLFLIFCAYMDIALAIIIFTISLLCIILFVLFNYEYFKFITLFSITLLFVILGIFYIYPIKSTPITENIETFVIAISNCSNDTDADTLVINIKEMNDSDDEDDIEGYLYALMEYNTNDVEKLISDFDIDIQDKLENPDEFKLTTDDNQKFEIFITPTHYTTVLSYFGFNDGQVSDVISTKLYINESNVKMITELPES